MDTHEPVSSTPKAWGVVRTCNWLGAVIETMDSRLRCRIGVSEYTKAPDCVLRMQIIRSTEDLRLEDGTCLRPGDRMVDLHIWNQQMPAMSEKGATLAWARRMNDGFKRSLNELAIHLAARNDVDDIVVVRAVAALGAEDRADKISRMLSRFGFEIVMPRETPSVTQKIRRFAENILISLMVLAYNPIALRSDTLMRGRVHGYLSRRTLDRRYGAAGEMETRQLAMRGDRRGNSTSCIELDAIRLTTDLSMPEEQRIPAL